MIRQQWNLLFRNRRFVMTLILGMFFSIIWLCYQQQIDGNNSKQHAECRNWALKQEKPIEALEEAYLKIFSIQNWESAEHYTENMYDEVQLISLEKEYFYQVLQYKVILGELIKTKRSAQMMPDATSLMIDKNCLEADIYEKLAEDINVAPGNYVALKKFFDFDGIDICILFIIYLICYYLIVVERENNICELIYSTKKGGIYYFIKKFESAIGIIVLVIMVLNILKYMILTGMYGCDDLSAPIQSIDGYIYSPWNISVAEYIVAFFVWKIIGYTIITMIVLVICSFSVSAVSTALITFAILLTGVIFKERVPMFSTYLLRDTSLIRLVTTEYWFSSLRTYGVVSGTNYSLVLYGLITPVLAASFYVMCGLGIGAFLYRRGLRSSSSSKNNKIVSLVGYRLGILGNETTYVLIKKKALLGIILILGLYGFFIADNNVDKSEKVKFERQIVSLLNEMSFEDAKKWIADKEKGYDELEEQLLDKQIQLSMGEISEETYTGFYNVYSNQMRIKEIIDEFKLQAEEMDGLQEQQLDLKFEFPSLAKAMYGANSRVEKNWISLLISVYIVFFIMVSFPNEKAEGIYDLSVSFSKTFVGLVCRAIVLMLSVFVLNIFLYYIWFYSLNIKYGIETLYNSEQSMRLFRDARGELTGIQALWVEVVLQSICWMIVSEIGIIISLFFDNIVAVEILGIILIVTVPATIVMGMEWSSSIFYSKYLYVGECLFNKSMMSVFALMSILVGLFIIMKEGIKSWTKS